MTRSITLCCSLYLVCNTFVFDVPTATAQDVPPESNWTATAATSGEDDLAASAELEPDYQGHFGVELLGGVLGVGGSALVGLAVFIGSAGALDCCDNSDSGFLFPALFGLGAASFSAVFLIPAGISIAGDRTGGNGSYWGALLGTGLVAVPGGLTLLGARPDDTLLYPALGALVTASILAGVLGYRWTADDESPSVAFSMSPDGRSASISVRGVL